MLVRRGGNVPAFGASSAAHRFDAFSNQAVSSSEKTLCVPTMSISYQRPRRHLVRK